MAEDMYCKRCGEEQTAMWGSLCNKCRKDDERHRETISAMRSDKGAEAYQRGFKDGFIEGQKQGMDAAQKILERATNVQTNVL